MIKLWVSILIAVAAAVMTAVLWLGDGGSIARIVALIVLAGAIVSAVVARRSKSAAQSSGNRRHDER